MPKSRVLVGEIVRARGIRGEVVIRSYTADPRMVAGYGPVTDDRGRTFAVAIEGTDGEMIRARIDGVDSRTQAEALRGTRLYVAREALPEPPPGEYYHFDLIGLDVVTADGTELGRVRTFEDHGAGAYLELDAEGPDGPICVPFTPETCAVDLGAGKIGVTLPEGLLDPAPKPDGGEADESTQTSGNPGANPRRRRGPVRWRRRRS